MNIEQIEKEIEHLKAEQRRLEADFHATRGAIIAYERMLTVMREQVQHSQPVQPISGDESQRQP